MRRLAGIAASLVILAALLAAAGPASGTAAKRSVTLQLVEKEQGSNFIDNPPRQGSDSPPLMGDQSADTSALQTKSGAHTGNLDTTCVVTRGGPNGFAVCTGIFSLKGGLLIGMARVTLAGGPVIIAITGGTGAYEGVTGSGTSTRRGGNSPYSDDTLHLIWP
jgi:hypothetical protein